MNKGAVQEIIMATTNNNPNICNINNNLIKPTLFISSSSPSSSSSTITNFLASSIYNNHSNDNIFQAHQYTMNMSTTTTSSSSWLDHHNHHHHPTHNSLSQLLLGGVYMEEEAKKIDNWDEQVLLQQQQHHHQYFEDQVKQENTVNSYIINTKNNIYGAHQINNIIPTSPPQSCVTNAFNNNNINNNNGNMLDFSSKCINDNLHPRHTNPIHVPHHSFEGKTTTTRGGVVKRAKVQQSSTQSTFKVRKEKLGDRITILHQLVSPFGKTDTASVLLESIGYIRFLHSQVEALSLPYLTSGAATKTRLHNNVEGERKSQIPEDPGQELHEEAKDLKSRGLCLVPLSCTMNVGSDNGADYWAPSFGGGFR